MTGRGDRPGGSLSVRGPWHADTGATTGRRSEPPRRLLAPFMVAALASLLLGLWAGLARIGWEMPAGDADLMLRHGGLMVAGFVATVIAIERAIALGTWPALAAPALSAATGLALVAGAPGGVPPALAAAAGLAYSLNVALLLRRHRQPPLAMLLGGGLCLVVAAVAWWDGGGLRRVVPWWMAFLVLTIAAERLEIIRFQRFTRAGVAGGLAIVALLSMGLLLTLADLDLGVRLVGAGFLATPVWLVRRDTARRTIRSSGVARFAAAGVLAAYGWLALAGALLLVRGFGSRAFEYDAALHAFFVGFVFSAIIAHAPIIAPAITGLRFRYTPLFYVPLMLLGGTLAVRIGSDLAQATEVRRWAGMAQALVLVLFLALVMRSMVAGGKGNQPARGEGRPA